MDFKKSENLDIDSYEILIRRSAEDNYSSYCPQLNVQINDSTHEIVEKKMQEVIYKHVEALSKK